MSHQAALELRRAGYIEFYSQLLEAAVQLLVSHGIDEGNAIAAVNSCIDMHDAIRLLDAVKYKYVEDG